MCALIYKINLVIKSARIKIEICGERKKRTDFAQDDIYININYINCRHYSHVDLIKCVHISNVVIHTNNIFIECCIRNITTTGKILY